MIYPLCRDPEGPTTSAPQKRSERGTHLSTRGLISVSNQGAAERETLNPQAVLAPP